MLSYVQKLVFSTQSNYFKSSRDSEEEFSEVTEEERTRRNWYVLGADIIFNESLDLGFESKNVSDMGDVIKKCLESNEPVVIEMNGLKIVLNSKNHKCVSFFGNNYRVTIDGEDMYSEVDVIKLNLDAHLTKRYNQGCLMDIPVKLSQTVTVTNGEEINEVCGIDSQDVLVDLDLILERFKRYNRDYYDVVDGDDKVLCRDITDFKEMVKRPYEYRGVNIDAGQAKKIGKFKDFKTYEDLIPVAKAREERCKYIYSLVLRAYDDAQEKMFPFGSGKRRLDDLDSFQSTFKNDTTLEKKSEKVMVKK